jgi:hypothetical protein
MRSLDRNGKHEEGNAMKQGEKGRLVQGEFRSFFRRYHSINIEIKTMVGNWKKRFGKS